MSRKHVIRNIGLLLSGDLDNPILDADTLVVEDGIIVQVGAEADCDWEQAELVVDACGLAVAPGLIDGHVHPTFGEYAPRAGHSHWISHCLQGGVTTMVSAGEVHVPGLPVDPIGTIALAIAAQRSFSLARPGGAKVIAGAPLLTEGLTRENFAEMAKAGIRLLGEVGIGTVSDVKIAKQMVAWARENGIRSLTHTGGPSIPGSRLMQCEEILEIDPDIIGHINGGHTALPRPQICRLCEESGRALELVHNGNEAAALHVLRIVREHGSLARLVLGTDSPSGSGVLSLGMLRLVCFISSIGEVPPEQAICLATGNTARVRGLNTGIVEVGREADLLLLSKPLGGDGKHVLDSIRLGDLPSIAMVIVDGEILVHPSPNTPPAEKLPKIQFCNNDQRI